MISHINAAQLIIGAGVLAVTFNAAVLFIHGASLLLCGPQGQHPVRWHRRMGRRITSGLVLAAVASALWFVGYQMGQG